MYVYTHTRTHSCLFNKFKGREGGVFDLEKARKNAHYKSELRETCLKAFSKSFLGKTIRQTHNPCWISLNLQSPSSLTAEPDSLFYSFETASLLPRWFPGGLFSGSNLGRWGSTSPQELPPTKCKRFPKFSILLGHKSLSCRHSYELTGMWEA